MLEAACAPLYYLCLTDVTDGHAVEGFKDGRALRADGRDIKLLVVSTCFRDKSGLERQEMVNAVLNDHIKSGSLHSVQMRCWEPDEWVAKGSPVNLGAPCSFSSTGVEDEAMLELGQPLPLASCTAADKDDLLPSRPAPPSERQQLADVADATPPSVDVVKEKFCECGATKLSPTVPPAHQPASSAPLPPLPPPPPPPNLPPRHPDEETRGAARRRVVPQTAAPQSVVLVEHLRAQGIRGLETAQLILKCDDASAGSREAASQFLAEQVVSAGDW